MKNKIKGNTGFRNDSLFCFNCGGSYTIPYPQPLSMASALMLQFAKDHENCSPTWVEPKNEVGKTVVENANWWAINGEHGLSSKTMFNHLTKNLQVRSLKNEYRNVYHPSDPDDFRRCYLLLESVPQWKEKSELEKLKQLSPVWEKLVDNWDKLTAMLEEMMQRRKDGWPDKKIPNGMYEFMKSLGC